MAVTTTRSSVFDLEDVDLERVRVRALRDWFPPGQAWDIGASLLGDRYLDAFPRADIVHGEELSFWFSAQAAELKRRRGFKLVLTVWETIPLLHTFRNHHARRYRAATLPAADLLLATTERARAALRLEGVPEERIRVWHPGVDLERFRQASAPRNGTEHVILSPGRLVWEKGHQDVLRAAAAIVHGLVKGPRQARFKVLLVGRGPERRRLEDYSRELGIRDLVEFESSSYAEMPSIYGRASCVVLASLANAGCGLFPGDLPRCFWEEQFGMVLAEAMACGLPIVASTSGAIPEVTAGRAEYFAPGDWLGLAGILARDVLSQPRDRRVQHPAELLSRYSIETAATALASAYDELMETERAGDEPDT